MASAAASALTIFFSFSHYHEHAYQAPPRRVHTAARSFLPHFQNLGCSHAVDGLPQSVCPGKEANTVAAQKMERLSRAQIQRGAAKLPALVFGISSEHALYVHASFPAGCRA